MDSKGSRRSYRIKNNSNQFNRYKIIQKYSDSSTKFEKMYRLPKNHFQVLIISHPQFFNLNKFKVITELNRIKRHWKWVGQYV